MVFHLSGEVTNEGETLTLFRLKNRFRKLILLCLKVEGVIWEYALINGVFNISVVIDPF